MENMKPFVDFSTYNESNPFGTRDPKYYPATKHHIGSDFKVAVATPIIAPVNGEMFKAVYNPARGNTGVFVFAHSGIEWGLELCHLRELPALGIFKQGDTVAFSGNTGTATTAPHLHVVMHRDAMVTRNYQDLVSEKAYFDLVKAGRLIDPYAWFRSHFNT